LILDTEPVNVIHVEQDDEPDMSDEEEYGYCLRIVRCRTDTWIDSEAMSALLMFGMLPPWAVLTTTFSLTRNLLTPTESKCRGGKQTHSYLADEAVSHHQLRELQVNDLRDLVQASIMMFRFSAELETYHLHRARRQFILFFWMHRLVVIARQQLSLAVLDVSNEEAETTFKLNSSSRLKIL
jgi:hypothetical protein